MVDRNAPLSETGRLRLARSVVDDGWPLRRAAERFQVSHTTAARWAGRDRQLGAAGMADRPSRPHASPRRTPARTERRIVGLRVSRRLGPARIAGRLGLPASTVHAVLARYGCPPLAHLDRGSPAVRRYERGRPGELVHVDVKKLGNIPVGGGWRVTGVARGLKNKRATTSLRHGKTSHPVIGCSCLHTPIDDCSRLACTEILTDERKETAAAFLARARLIRRRRNHHRTGGILVRTIAPQQARSRLRGARAGTAQPPRLPDPLTVTRRVSVRGAIMIGGQKIQVGLAQARKTAQVTVESDTYQITVEPGITITAPRTTSRDIRRHKASNYD